MSSYKTHRLFCLALLSCLLASPREAHAVDGVIEINQVRADAGGVTPGDAPGFPVTLSQPGSYRLTGNLTVPDRETTAIQVTSDDVSIDLNGFALLGPNIANGFGRGVSASGRTNIQVRNGTIRGMGERGLFLGNRAVVEDLRSLQNLDGIEVGIDSRVMRSSAIENRVAGIKVFGKSLVLDCVASRNGEDGIVAGQSSRISGNTVNNNGRYGILTDGTGLLLHNTLMDNDDFGLLLQGPGNGYGGNILVDNTANPGGPQVQGGTQIATNICGTDTVCP